jgi:sulfite exporter TauE/SafE
MTPEIYIIALNALSGLILGLSASLHCLGMCGAIASSIGVTTNANKNYTKIFLYNFGRVFSYLLFGILVGFLGAGFVGHINQSYGLSILRLIACFTLLYLAFKIGNFLPNIKLFASFFAKIEKTVSKIGARLDRFKSKPAWFFSGMVWGLLPCSMVYSTIFYALTTSASLQNYNILSSGIIMLFFGIGTLPSMVTSGVVGKELIDRIKNTIILPKILAVIIIMVAFLTLFLHPPFVHGTKCH